MEVTPEAEGTATAVAEKEKADKAMEIVAAKGMATVKAPDIVAVVGMAGVAVGALKVATVRATGATEVVLGELVTKAMLTAMDPV